MAPGARVAANAPEAREVALIGLATRLTDRSDSHSSNADWLRAFRRHYRYLAASIGQTLEFIDDTRARAGTEAELKASLQT